MRRYQLKVIIPAVIGLLLVAGSGWAGLPAATVSAAGDSTSLMVVFGDALYPGGYWDMPTGSEIQVTNNRTDETITAIVGDTEPGVYEAIFFQSESFVARVGDVISFSVVDGFFNSPNGFYQLTADDILAGMVRYDVMPDGVSAVPLPEVPTGLTSVHPNPFNPKVNISLELTESSQVELSIFDFRGHRVTVLSNGILSAGPHRFQWEGLNERGEAMPSGVYLVRMTAPGFVTGKKITLVR